VSAEGGFDNIYCEGKGLRKTVRRRKQFIVFASEQEKNALAFF
jgi:hypothetical protein